MVDYVSLPSSTSAAASTSSLFSSTLPSIINADPLHSCATSYNLSFPPSGTALSTDLLANEHEDIWRGSSIAALRRKAVEYQAGSSTHYKWLSVSFCSLLFFFSVKNRFSLIMTLRALSTSEIGVAVRVALFVAARQGKSRTRRIQIEFWGMPHSKKPRDFVLLSY